MVRSPALVASPIRHGSRNKPIVEARLSFCCRRGGIRSRSLCNSIGVEDPIDTNGGHPAGDRSIQH